MARVEAVAEIEPALVVLHGLAGVERERGRHRLARIGFELRAREAERILGVGLAQAVADEGKRSVVADPPAELRIEMVARRRAVVTVAIRLEARQVADGVERTGSAAELEPGAPAVVAAEPQ